MKIAVITDNPVAHTFAKELYAEYTNKHKFSMDIYQSPKGNLRQQFWRDVKRIDVKKECYFLINSYDLIISIHCKQLFPPELVRGVRCVNVHPGYNPFNRGWFPQIFSIINGLPCGVTIHEMDEQLDHGNIIVQRQYDIKSWDTSETVYDQILKIERELLFEYFPKIINKEYTGFKPHKDGNLNLKKDFDLLKEIKLDESAPFGYFINLLRAMTHGKYKNAYFTDKHGNKVYVGIQLEKEKESS